ncbi:acyltransferase family protein [Pseudoalteromonas sp. NEC-BIFX-2020_015]|uniref:acyltransferase family protein n=1 Tax=Pseudoalteromonas sp. NEC-BIFX-2020_015 TaxID=2729544 RepID=UPI0014612E04|nr:acyltransferase family protein [Pseudoalteromonas sp. NEC-BIFX-2020_015]NMR23947.1 acyltransferase family protein [Pseudoalteromonas sp. NEC-BIFX-2020_015]
MRSDIELIRILSAFGIVWFHSSVFFGKSIAYTGLVFFIITAVFYTLRSNKESPIKTKIERLILPCLLWSLIYFILYRFIGKVPTQSTENIFFDILSTPSIHLWYLAFIFIVTVFIVNLKKHLPTNFTLLFFSLLLPTLFYFGADWRAYELTSPLPQYLHALPAVLIGYLFYCFEVKKNNLARLIILTSILVSIIFLYISKLPGLSSTYIVGISFSILLLLNKPIIKTSPYINSFSKLTFGIYLIHIIPLAILNKASITGWLLPTLAFISSAFVIYIAKLIIPNKLQKYIL